MADVVRTPKQQRSIDKKNRIIAAGYTLFAQKGYYNTNTAEIAKEAGVSTGIVYGYFHDKRDILVEVLDIYIQNAYGPIFSLLEEISSPVRYDALIAEAVDTVVDSHAKNAAIHEALDSLSHTDKAIREKFVSLENELANKIVEKLSSVGQEAVGVNEKVHLAMKLISTYAHEYVYDKHDYISYPRLRLLTIDAVKKLFAE